jgi:hypothetical protein
MSTVDFYLYALATIAVTFVGFSTLLIVFRQTIGGKLTPYDVYFVLSFMQSGFLVAAGALLPPLVSLYGLGPEQVWRVASGIIAIPYIFFVISVPARRRRATGAPLPVFILPFERPPHDALPSPSIDRRHRPRHWGDLPQPPARDRSGRRRVEIPV